jgi:hypothetical protein
MRQAGDWAIGEQGAWVTWKGQNGSIRLAEGLAGLRIYGLRRARRRSLILEKRYQELMADVEELAPQLNAYIKTLARIANRRGAED